MILNYVMGARDSERLGHAYNSFEMLRIVFKRHSFIVRNVHLLERSCKE